MYAEDIPAIQLVYFLKERTKDVLTCNQKALTVKSLKLGVWRMQTCTHAQVHMCS